MNLTWGQGLFAYGNNIHPIFYMNKVIVLWSFIQCAKSSLQDIYMPQNRVGPNIASGDEIRTFAKT